MAAALILRSASMRLRFRPPIVRRARPTGGGAPTGVDVLGHPALIRATFPYFAQDVAAVLHVRRAGSISGQQLGQFMLETVRAAGGRLLRGKVVSVEDTAPFRLAVETPEGTQLHGAGRLLNAAGPFFTDMANLLGEKPQVHCVY